LRPQAWRRLRQLSQTAALVLFLGLFVRTPSLGPRYASANLFYRLDPLVALTAGLAGRGLIAALGLAVVTVVLTLLFGRVWCGWLCPLGTVLDWLRPRGKRQRSEGPSDRWRAVKVLLLGAILLAALLGSQTLLFLDPLTIMTRTLATAVWPAARHAAYQGEAFLYRFRPLWEPLDWLHGRLVYPLFRDIESVFSLAVPILLFFALLVALSWWAERFWCRYLCPLGGLLGLISRVALLRRTVEEECSNCGHCARECPTGTIDAARGYRSDPAECTVCYDCIPACPQSSNGFRWHLPLTRAKDRPAWRPAESQTYDPSRKELLVALGTAAVGVALGGVEPISKRQPARMIRPPGAASDTFTALCIRCGQCVRVCPTQGLQPTLLEVGWQNTLTPLLVPRLGYCSFSCNACGLLCPTGAIPPLALEQKQHTPIGLASVDRDRCLPWAYNIPCIVCEEACPVASKAIGLEEIEAVDAAGDQITLQRPSVVKELCIGCGICEYKCPVGGEAAIQVFAPTEAGGYLGLDPDFEPRQGR
jgi:MauM/NapG family ferredoxin protein